MKIATKHLVRTQQVDTICTRDGDSSLMCRVQLSTYPDAYLLCVHAHLLKKTHLLCIIWINSLLKVCELLMVGLSELIANIRRCHRSQPFSFLNHSITHTVLAYFRSFKSITLFFFFFKTKTHNCHFFSHTQYFSSASFCLFIIIIITYYFTFSLFLTSPTLICSSSYTFLAFLFFSRTLIIITITIMHSPGLICIERESLL